MMTSTQMRRLIRQMRATLSAHSTPACLTIAALLWLPAGLMAQGTRNMQGTPAKPSAAAPPASFTAAPATTAPPKPSDLPPHRAEVTYASGELHVTADNSSLNQILQQISQRTGLKITGGVVDERVFGKYGPSTLSAVLASLLDGTGSNMLLIQNKPGVPDELILTPRNGGVTPPNPNASHADEDPEVEMTPAEQAMPPTPLTARPGMRMGMAPTAPSPAPAAAPQQEATPVAPQTAPAEIEPNAASPSTENPTDPNAVKTPQQIFEQLQKMHQQHQ